MKEARGIIKSVNTVKEKVKQLGGSFENNYSFTDIIFIPNFRKIDLNKEFIRLRIYNINNWPTKNIILIHKKTKWEKESKTSKIILKKEFDNRKDANDFIKNRFKNKIKKFLEYFRRGEEYHLGQIRLFIEKIKGFKPTIEIEATNEKSIRNLFKQLNVIEKLSDSVPETMRKSLK